MADTHAEERRPGVPGGGTLRDGCAILVDLVSSRLDINHEELAGVFRFQLASKLLLVDRLAPGGDLLLRIPRVRHNRASRSRFQLRHYSTRARPVWRSLATRARRRALPARGIGIAIPGREPL